MRLYCSWCLEHCKPLINVSWNLFFVFMSVITRSYNRVFHRVLEGHGQGVTNWTHTKAS